MSLDIEQAKGINKISPSSFSGMLLDSSSLNLFILYAPITA